MIIYLCLKHHISPTSIHIGCDNQWALDISFRKFGLKVNPKWKHADIVSGIIGLRKLNIIHIIPVHISRHQDLSTKYDDLPWLAQMNVHMDCLTKTACSLVKEGHLVPLQHSSHPLGFLPVTALGNVLHHEYNITLYSAIANKNTHNWWLTKGHYKLEDTPKINWDICQEASFFNKMELRLLRHGWQHQIVVFSDERCMSFLSTR